MRVRIIDNPYSHRGPYPVDRVLPTLAEAGWDVDVVHREPGRSVRQQVHAALDRGCEMVVGAGGDGTLRDIASSLAGRDAALGVLPGGTANVMAHELGVAGGPEAAARGLVRATNRRIDLGRLVLPDERAGHFLMMAGLGADGLMLALTDPRLKRLLGAGGIAVGAVRALPAIRPFHVDVRTEEGEAWSGDVLQVIVGNTRRYANVIEATPSAFADDGLLDLTAIPAAGLRPAARLAWSLLAARKPRPGDVPHLRSRRFSVETDVVPPMEFDGSPVRHPSVARAGRGPYRIEIAPGALLLRVPRDYGGAIFRDGA